MDLFPKTATDLLKDIQKYRDGKMTKAKLIEEWKGQQWSSTTMRQWAIWQWRNAGLTTERPE